MFLFAEMFLYCISGKNVFILHQNFSQSFIYSFGNSPLGNHLMSYFCQATIDLIRNDSPYFNILQEILL